MLEWVALINVDMKVYFYIKIINAEKLRVPFSGCAEMGYPAPKVKVKTEDWWVYA